MKIHGNRPTTILLDERLSITAAAVWLPVGWLIACWAPWLGLSSPGTDEVINFLAPAITFVLVAWNLIVALALVYRSARTLEALPVTLVQIALFGLLFFQLASHVGSHLYRWNRPPGLADWTIFAVAHAARASDMMDAIEAYGLGIQTIHGHSHLVAWALVMYHAVVTTFVLSLLFESVQRIRRFLLERESDVLAWQAIGTAFCLAFVVTWLMSALIFRPWRFVDLLLWPLDNALRVIDFLDVLEIYHLRLHMVPLLPWEATLTFVCRVILAVVLANKLNQWSRVARLLVLAGFGLDERELKDLRNHSNPLVVERAERRLEVLSSPTESASRSWEIVRDKRWLGGIAAVFVVCLLLVPRGNSATEQLAREGLEGFPWSANRALSALRREGSRAAAAVPILGAGLDEAPVDRQLQVIETLGHLGAAAIEPLERLLESDNEARQLAAIDALEQIGPRASLALASALGNQNSAVHEPARDAVRSFGRNGVHVLMNGLDPENCSVVVRLLNDLDPYWRWQRTSNPHIPAFLACESLLDELTRQLEEADSSRDKDAIRTTLAKLASHGPLAATASESVYGLLGDRQLLVPAFHCLNRIDRGWLAVEFASQTKPWPPDQTTPEESCLTVNTGILQHWGIFDSSRYRPEMQLQVTYSVQSATANPTIDPQTGIVQWCPAERHGPGEHEITWRVADDQGTLVERVFRVDVTEVNRPPTLVIDSQHPVVDRDGEVTFRVLTQDPDEPPNDCTVEAGVSFIRVDPDGTVAMPAANWQDRPTLSVTDNGSPPLRTSIQLPRLKPDRVIRQGVEFVLIQPGVFHRGAKLDDPLAKADEKPRHTVRLAKPLWMSATEITNAQFRTFIQQSSYVTDAVRRRSENWLSASISGRDHPVVNVSWNDAWVYCQWLTKGSAAPAGASDEPVYRLPTECEWEYCCRARSDSRFCPGEQFDSLQGFANVRDPSSKLSQPAPWLDGWAATAPVGSFKPNDWRLYDLHGNVSEWCWDWYSAKFYATAANDPDSDVANRGPLTGTQKSIRGGSWQTLAAAERVTARRSLRPDDCRDDVGFRVVCSSLEFPPQQQGLPKREDGTSLASSDLPTTFSLPSPDNQEPRHVGALPSGGVKMRLLGGNVAARGSRFALTMNAGTASVWLRNPTGVVRQVAAIGGRERDLLFRWLPEASSSPFSSFLANCLLAVEMDARTHIIALRPVQRTPIVRHDGAEAFVNVSFKLAEMPPTQSLKLEPLPHFPSMKTTVSPNPRNPMSGKATVELHAGASVRVKYELTSRVKDDTCHLKVVGYVMMGQRETPFTRTLVSQLNGSLVARLSTVRAKAARFPLNKKLAKEVTDLEGTTDALSKALQLLSDRNSHIGYRVLHQVDEDHELELVRSASASLSR